MEIDKNGKHRVIMKALCYRRKKTKSTTRINLKILLDKQLYLSGVDYVYESEKLPYTLYYNYIPDFVISLPSGNKRYIEAKGILDQSIKLRWRQLRSSILI